MEKLGLKGVLKLRFFRDGELVGEHKDNNLVVATGWGAIFSGLSGVANKNISKVQCGTNGNDPVLTDTSITGAVDLDISSIVHTNESLTISFQLGANDANGITIAEFGLICADGSLFSRKSWTPFLKLADLSVEGTWTISKA